MGWSVLLSLHCGFAIDMESDLDAVVGATRLPAWDDWDGLPYLQALIKELQGPNRHCWEVPQSFRAQSVSADGSDAGIPHVTTQDSEYREVIIR